MLWVIIIMKKWIQCLPGFIFRGEGGSKKVSHWFPFLLDIELCAASLTTNDIHSVPMVTALALRFRDCTFNGGFLFCRFWCIWPWNLMTLTLSGLELQISGGHLFNMSLSFVTRLLLCITLLVAPFSNFLCSLLRDCIFLAPCFLPYFRPCSLLPWLSRAILPAPWLPLTGVHTCSREFFKGGRNLDQPLTCSFYMKTDICEFTLFAWHVLSKSNFIVWPTWGILTINDNIVYFFDVFRG